MKEFFETQNQGSSWSSSISSLINFSMVLAIMVNLLIDHKVGIDITSMVVIIGLQVSLMTDVVRKVHSSFILYLTIGKGLLILATAIIAGVVLPEALEGWGEIGSFGLFLIYLSAMMITDVAGIIMMIIQRRAN